MPSDLICKCERCGVWMAGRPRTDGEGGGGGGLVGGAGEGTLCDCCRMDIEILGAVADWSSRTGIRDILEWEGESLVQALEYDFFMLAMQALGERPPLSGLKGGG